MRATDHWGWRARLGMFIVGNEAVPEAEWWAMMPEGVSVHAARVTARAPWASWEADGTVSLAEDVVRGARQFATMRLDAVVVGHSSSSILGGKGWDQAVVKALSELTPDTRVTTNGIDCLAALAELGVARPFVVFPPWFNNDIVDAGVAYFAAHGVTVAGHMRADAGLGWRDLAPSELYPQGKGFEQDVEALYRQIRAECPAEADGVLIAGTGFRCVSVLAALESDLGRPVVSANQASLWHCLHLSGVRALKPGFGRLLSPDRSSNDNNIPGADETS